MRRMWVAVCMLIGFAGVLNLVWFRPHLSQSRKHMLV